MKLTLVGAGGFRTPAIYRALVAGAGTTRFDEVVLFDPDPERLEQIGAVLDGIDSELGDRVAYRSSGDLRDALEGADVVYCAIRVGGLEGRLLDERIAVDAGAIGQETTGAGGIAFALRTVPAATAIAEQVARHAPDALFINFTNPAGLVTEALQRVLGDRVVGICDAPPDMCQRVATALGMPVDQLWFDYFGINHLGWLRAVRHRERDLLPGLLADDDRLAGFEEGRLFGGEWLRAVGMLPNEYLYYYYFEREALASMQAGNLRASVLLSQQSIFYDGNGDASGALEGRELGPRGVLHGRGLVVAGRRDGGGERSPGTRWLWRRRPPDRGCHGQRTAAGDDPEHGQPLQHAVPGRPGGG